MKGRRSLWVLRAIGILFGALVLYLLALGPIFRIYGARPSHAWDRLPRIVRLAYEPLDKLPIPEPIGKLLRGYNRWWMRADTEKADFIKQIAQLDSWIRPGMLQSDVVRALGETPFWQTNSDGVVADYYFDWPMVPFDILTNGFKITFSNGVVIGKEPNTVLSDGK